MPPLPLELAPPIIPLFYLFYFSRAPSRPWWVAAAVANSNINLKGLSYLLLAVHVYAHRVFDE
jgi:hypothetical protein